MAVEKNGQMATPLRPCLSFRIRLLGDMLLLRDCLGFISLYIILLSSKFNSSTFFVSACKSARIRYGKFYTNGTCYFDEMMKAYINIKNNSSLHTHQALNKRIWLMKRESGRPHISLFFW